VFLTESGQNSFDVFSWQSFIALNWPIDPATGELTDSINAPDHYPRRWSSYQSRKQLLGDDEVSSVCSTQAKNKADSGPAPSPLVISRNFLQTNGQPLIDRNGNYVVYDVRVNGTMSDYILANGLETKSGQTAFFAKGETLDFPKGRYAQTDSRTGGEPGSIAIKTSWKVLSDRSADNNRYFTVDGLVPVTAANSGTGQAFCLDVKLGLVGMHIMRRTESGNGDKWIWSTFEHIDNAPLANNYRRANDVVHAQPFENGCKAPVTVDRMNPRLHSGLGRSPIA